MSFSSTAVAVPRMSVLWSTFLFSPFSPPPYLLPDDSAGILAVSSPSPNILNLMVFPPVSSAEDLFEFLLRMSHVHARIIEEVRLCRSFSSPMVFLYHPLLISPVGIPSFCIAWHLPILFQARLLSVSPASSLSASVIYFCPSLKLQSLINPRRFDSIVEDMIEDLSI